MDTSKELRSYTVEEFYNLPEDTTSELIDGQLINMAPPSTIHQRLSGRLYRKIAEYIEAEGGSCEVFTAPFGVQLLENEDTVVEPDISVICDPSKLTERGCVGAPDWIIEIVSPGNPGYDYIIKLQKYLAAGVREYWIVDPLSSIVTVYDLSEGKTVPVRYALGVPIKSGIYDNLSINFADITGYLF